MLNVSPVCGGIDGLRSALWSWTRAGLVVQLGAVLFILDFAVPYGSYSSRHLVEYNWYIFFTTVWYLMFIRSVLEIPSEPGGLFLFPFLARECTRRSVLRCTAKTAIKFHSREAYGKLYMIYMLSLIHI